nr:MAG TPA: hypothetical protein [Bacteriophage sp.]DAK87603.1 MAG TPA: hypothetical protein [Bacteriophage sp.]DAM09518.1 MAG TPA: hypothetical protein [Bacteriophage sp.]DAR98892.1 MAG TPA: hypothetical protein [Bacteriophage sp.]DAV23481.1 MAG TPA: hypothetical protein [Bacteriophage sp.]
MHLLSNRPPSSHSLMVLINAEKHDRYTALRFRAH